MMAEVTDLRTDRGHPKPGAVSHAVPVGPANRTVEQLLAVIAAAERSRPALADPPGRASSGLAPWQILRVRDFVESGLASAIHVGALAKVARLSASHFARAFRTSFGVTPAAYVLARRLERAKALMLATGEPLCRISLDCGFTDQSHLSRVFRRRVGQSPSEWRRWHRVA